MYYPDLTPYRYYSGDERHINIGWLDAQHPFPKKKASKELLDALFERCLRPVNQTRGYHVCQLCRRAPFGVEVSRHGKNNKLGSAEIRVEGEDGKVYAAPNLIYHYVAEHDYAPPEEFVEALSQ